MALSYPIPLNIIAPSHQMLGWRNSNYCQPADADSRSLQVVLILAGLSGLDWMDKSEENEMAIGLLFNAKPNWSPVSRSLHG
jgi:hypothetical protein